MTYKRKTPFSSFQELVIVSNYIKREFFLLPLIDYKMVNLKRHFTLSFAPAQNEHNAHDFPVVPY
ncbi:hypothetical protein K8353_42745, partial [Burkholderia contaminans]|nr:hypothetical protein [Burkholderia contaminans]